MEQEKLMTCREVAEHIRMHPASVRRLANEGKIPSRKFGRMTRIPAAWVYEKSQCRRAVNAGPQSGPSSVEGKEEQE